MEINKNDIEWKVASALVKIEMSLLDMGDSYEEVTDWLCDEAGITFNEENYHGLDYYERINKKAYYIILKEKNPNDVLNSSLNYFLENKENIVYNLIYYKNVTNNKHPLIKSIILILEYVIDLHKKGICDDEVFKLANELYDDFSTIDLRACLLGKEFGRTFYNLLDEKYFHRNNNGFVCGGISYDDEFKGSYVCHAEFINNFFTGYTIVFYKEDNKHLVKIYEYERVAYSSITNKDIGVVIDITKKKDYIQEVVNKLNELVR